MDIGDYVKTVKNKVHPVVYSHTVGQVGEITNYDSFRDFQVTFSDGYIGAYDMDQLTLAEDD